MMQITSDRPAGSRTALVYTLLIIVVLSIFAVALTTYMSRSLEKRTEEELTQQVVLLVNTMSSYHEALSESAIKIASVFKSHFPEHFSLDTSQTITIDGKKTPVIKNGSAVLNLNYSIVDRFTAVTKAVGTVFVRTGNDFIRVSTSLKKEDGSRAIGTVLDRKHPAYQGLLNGIEYVGKAELFGKDYMTSYQPVKDGKGNVIAVLFIGLDFTENLKGLKEKIRNTKIGKSGYIYVLDAKEGRDFGKLQIHPYKEGSNFVDARDSDGRAFIREILEKKEGIIRYPWINKEIGETKTSEKLVAYKTLKEWNWIICAGSRRDELNKEAGTLLKAMIGATTLVAFVLILLFRKMLRIEKGFSAELQKSIDEYQESQEELQVTEEMLRAQVDDYMQSQDELQATEEMLREQLKNYQVTHDQLLAAEEMLRIQLKVAEESSQKFKVLFDNSPITVVLNSFPEGNFYEVNQAFIDMFRYKREEVIGKRALELGLWSRENERNRYLQLLQEDRNVHNFEATMCRKNGEEISVLFSGAMLEISGKPFVLSAIMDITEQRQLQNQLHQSQKMDVVGQLAGGIAHDFNNMLTGIMAAAEMLKTKLTSDDKQHKLLDTIIEATNRSADLTRELLTFSRKGTGISSPIRINDTIASVLSLLERTIDKRIQLIARLDGKNPIIMGDETQLQNALLNLGVNARDAMPQGGTLTYTTSERVLDADACQAMGLSLPSGHYLELAVSDTGVGMTKAVMEHIFEPFFTTKEVNKGTGLGLAAVYGAVKSHNGEIWVQSHPGMGSIFKIFLPLATAESTKQMVKQEVVTGSGGILLVDDEEMLRTGGRDLLEDLGYTLFLAEDGKHALELFAAHQNDISLVMLDMIMPRMGGTETFLKLREQAPEVKVLFCSGFSREETGDELVRLGASGFIQKPYTRSELSRAVAEALGEA